MLNQVWALIIPFKTAYCGRFAFLEPGKLLTRTVVVLFFFNTIQNTCKLCLALKMDLMSPCILCKTRQKYSRCCQVTGKYAHDYKKAQLKHLHTCRDALWCRNHSQSDKIYTLNSWIQIFHKIHVQSSELRGAACQRWINFLAYTHSNGA